MKKQLLMAVAVLFTAGTILMTGCKKDDTTPPSVSLTGSASMNLSLQGTLADPGATATDDEDGELTVTSDWSSTNPNKNMTGVYTITYTATDAAGNVGTATRTISVVNDASILANTWSVHDSCGVASVFNYAQTVTASTTLNGRIHFNKFGDYSNNPNIYADVTGTTINLPSQTATGIGSLSETHQFQGSGSIVGSTFTITYTDQNQSVTPPATATCIAKFQ